MKEIFKHLTKKEQQKVLELILRPAIQDIEGKRLAAIIKNVLSEIGK